jgi:membrane protein implicated in regulation of membrane protease activity
MIWIYVASALFGGFFLIPMMLGGLELGDGGLDGAADGLDGDFDGGLDLEAEPELGTGGPDPVPGLDGTVDAAVDGAGADGAFGAIAASVLSFRTIVFFTAFFGASGTVLTLLDAGPTLTLVSAVLIGLFAGGLVSVLFGLLRSSEANSHLSDRALVGRPATVVLPVVDGRPGRVRIDLEGQPQYLVARAVDDGTEQQYDVGTSVVVVEIENGTAMVASLAELDMGEEY